MAYTQSGNVLLLDVLVQPGASRTEIVGLHGDALRIRLQAPPVDGKANAALCEFLARHLELPKRAVEIVGGLSNRRKRVRVEGAGSDALQRLGLIEP